MKKDIHPKIYPALFVDLSTGAEFVSFTTRKTQETKKIGDTEYNVVKVEITSDSHPFFTGKQKIIDTAGRVDKFRAKMQKMHEMKEKKGKVAENIAEISEPAAAEATIEETVEKTVEKKPTKATERTARGRRRVAVPPPERTEKKAASTTKKTASKKTAKKK